MKKAAVVGAQGRMGREILAILQAKDIQATGFSHTTSPVTKKSIQGHDLVIDFSSPEGFESALKACVDLEIPLVSGTTGLSAHQRQKLAIAAKKIPVLWSSNMSLGVALLKKAVELFGQLKGFDFQIEELHHNKKKDRPSGTAIALQEVLLGALNKGHSGKKQKAPIPEPVVIRAGGIVGIHKAYAVSEDELLCFEHQALNRRVFAVGAVQAAEWLLSQKPSLYHIEDIFNV